MMQSLDPQQLDDARRALGEAVLQALAESETACVTFTQDDALTVYGYDGVYVLNFGSGSIPYAAASASQARKVS